MGWDQQPIMDTRMTEHGEKKERQEQRKTNWMYELSLSDNEALEYLLTTPLRKKKSACAIYNETEGDGACG